MLPGNPTQTEYEEASSVMRPNPPHLGVRETRLIEIPELERVYEGIKRTLDSTADSDETRLAKGIGMQMASKTLCQLMCRRTNAINR